MPLTSRPSIVGREFFRCMLICIRPTVQTKAWRLSSIYVLKNVTFSSQSNNHARAKWRGRRRNLKGKKVFSYVNLYYAYIPNEGWTAVLKNVTFSPQSNNHARVKWRGRRRNPKNEKVFSYAPIGPDSNSNLLLLPPPLSRKHTCKGHQYCNVNRLTRGDLLVPGSALCSLTDSCAWQQTESQIHETWESPSTKWQAIISWLMIKQGDCVCWQKQRPTDKPGSVFGPSIIRRKNASTSSQGE